VFQFTAIGAIRQIHFSSFFVKEESMAKIPIPCPQRVRVINGSFSWLDHRLIREGHLEKLSRDEIALYTFLVLVANQHGVSYYSQAKICHYLDQMDLEDFLQARERLVEVGLICFQPYCYGNLNGVYQVLAVADTAGVNQT